MYAKNFHVSIKDLRICAKIQYWKTLLSEIVIREFLRMYGNIIHVTIKDLCICAQNPVLEDFVIRNHY